MGFAVCHFSFLFMVIRNIWAIFVAKEDQVVNLCGFYSFSVYSAIGTGLLPLN